MFPHDELFSDFQDDDDPQPNPSPEQLRQERRWQRITFGVAIAALVAILVGASL